MTSHDHHHDHDGCDQQHGHARSHVSAETPARKLATVLIVTASFMIVEVVAGFLTGSLALLADAGHMLTDAGALTVALFAQRIAQRERSRQRTFGYRRAEVLAALGNGVVLGVSSVWIVVEAVRRFRAPPEVQGMPLLLVATLGLVLNVVSARLLLSGSRTNANVRAAAAHVAADAFGSVGAILAGIAVWAFQWNVADPIISIGISALILWSSWKVLRESIDVLMEGAPRGADVASIEKTIAGTSGVAAVHDLHVWCVSDGMAMITVHVVLDGHQHGTDVAAAVAQRVRDEHHIEHVTVQPEAPLAADALVQLGTPK